ncbi:uroporphyrinogen-III C-methyltransferase [Aliagarivorans marinus]|uniref:uroporphyrinogen-III C-methyltransferase n=1 Tax=Aliagarivorans marinus TaxID=561965 RepID=UPI0004251CEA|nr:uroporphyrinogen-III C-methyltransferase [Aliagarivorans marinus]
MNETLPSESQTDASASAAPTASEKSDSAPKKQSKSLLPVILAVIAIILVLALAGLGYWQLSELKEQQSTQMRLLNTSQDAREQQYREAQQQDQQRLQQLNALIEAQQSTIDGFQQQLESASQDAADLQQALALMNVKDANHWRLNEANYLLQLAANKLWLEQDSATASMLLSEADASLAVVNDPHLLTLRRAIAQDLQTIQALPLVDRTGIALKLESMLEQVEALQLAAIELPEALEEQDQALSDSAADWQENLAKSWQRFSENFVTVRRRDGQVEALIEPQHAWYLNENLKLQLQQAEQALFRQQGELFKAKLARAEQWIGQYFTQNAQAEALISDLRELQTLDIQVEVPDTLASLAAAEQAIKQREQRLIREPLAEGGQ